MVQYLQRTLFFILIISTHVLVAQDLGKQRINVDFQQASISRFVTDIESKSGYRFYYDPAQMNGFTVTLKADQKTVIEILDLVFKDTEYHFAVQDNRVVFLTHIQQINTTLAEGYLKALKSPVNLEVAAQKPENKDSDKNVIEATTENKLYEIGLKTNDIKAGTATLAGYVLNSKTGSPINGAHISVVDYRASVLSDEYGFFSLTIPRGQHVLLIKRVGIMDARRRVILYSDGKLNIEVQDQVRTLKEVNIVGQKLANVKSVEMGLTRLDIKSIKQVPSAFGEVDILRVVLTLPGVQSVGEASTGFNVRGGSADQNLILLNDATIYNPSHFFGFFSAFNPDIVQDVQLYKSSIPERFGGRLSSVLDVTNREGNKSKFTGSAGIGLITSRLNIEGPIDSGRTSFIMGGRTTYSNWLLDLLPSSYKNSKAGFTDLNLGISHKMSNRSNIYLNGYYSNDNFKLNSDTSYGYSNKNASIKWKYNFSDKFFGVFTGGFDKYEYKIGSSENPVTAYQLKFDISQINFKSDFTYYLNPNNTMTFGLSSIRYNLHPGNFQPKGAGSLIRPDVMNAEKALESALYLGDKWDIGTDFSISAGVRYSLYNYLGPQRVYNYAPNQPKSLINLVDSTIYGNNKVINTYYGPEFRVSARYNLTPDLSVKAAYNSLRQYIHLLSNTTAIAPTDVYKLSDPNIKPQIGDQISVGLYKNFNKNTIETSVEVYYKKLKDFLDYKSGANLVLNHHVETDVIGTVGKAYGIELFVKKSTGMLNGWVSYAYSKTFLKMDDPTIGTLVNNGAYYPANYDKPHAFNLAGNYRVTHRYSFSLNFTYSTGRPITLPIAKYQYAGSERVYYSDRNAYRIPDYLRADISMNIEGNHRLNQLTHNSWTVGVYNITGRKNAYSTYFIQESGIINGYKLSIFAAAIPFVNYNIRF